MSEDNGFAVRGCLYFIKDGTESVDTIEGIINQFIEIAAKRGYAEGVLDTLRSPQRAEKVVPRGVTEEEVQMDQLKRWSSYKQGVTE